MLEKNNDSFGICIKFRTKLQIPIFDFRHIFLMREDFWIKITISYFFLVQKKPKKYGIHSFVRKSMQIPKLSLFLF